MYNDQFAHTLVFGFRFCNSPSCGCDNDSYRPNSVSLHSKRKAVRKNIPEKLRNLISIESASNDGLGYPFAMLPILWMIYKPGEALSYWLTHTILWEVIGAVMLGAVIGYLAGYLLKIALRKKTIDESSYATYTIALALILLSSVKLLGADGILAVFAAGTAFSTTSIVEERRDEDRVVECIDLFFTIPIFTLLGLVAP